MTGDAGCASRQRLAAAKINLALHVTGRRADGYHLLDSIAVFAGIGDTIAVDPAPALGLTVRGSFAAHAPGDASDLAFRAAFAFFERSGIQERAAIEVEKRIPAGAGLGGGSADAAAVLLSLNALHDNPLSGAEIAELGLPLGADVPMCLAGQALRARGVGEQIALLRGWPKLPMVLVWPGVPVSTAEAFRTLARRDNPPLPAPPAAVDAAVLAAYLAACRNDLEQPALRLSPAIGAVLGELRASIGCLLARMSGSGSACFGLYASEAEAASAATAIGDANPAWWVLPTTAN